MVQSSAEESAGKLSLGPRESDVVSTGRSAVSPGELEVKVCSAIPRGRRTPVDVRRHDWPEVVHESGVEGPGVGAKEPGRGSIPLLAAVSGCYRVAY